MGQYLKKPISNRVNNDDDGFIEEEWSKKIVTASIKKELEEPKRNYAFNSFMIGSCHDLGFCLACGT